MSAYPPIGKVKTIVLPMDASGIYTLAQYKERFGIDLIPFIRLYDNRIELKFPDDCILFVSVIGEKGGLNNYLRRGLYPILSHDFSQYVSGNTNGHTDLYILGNVDDGGIAFRLFISKDETFTLDNLVITIEES